MKEIREHGSQRRYYHTRLGINGRLDTLQCAILLAKLNRYQKEIELRQIVAQRYNEAFNNIQFKGLALPFIEQYNQSVWAQYTLRVPKRDTFQKMMTEQGIPTSIHYPLIMPDQPWYQKHLDQKRDWPHARKAAQEVISLPFYPDLSVENQNLVIQAVQQTLSRIL